MPESFPLKRKAGSKRKGGMGGNTCERVVDIRPITLIGGDIDQTFHGAEGLRTDLYNCDASLKEDHVNRPLWICSDGRIFLESFSGVYKAAYDFLISVAEPVCRPANVHEYVLTPHSLYAAVSIGLETSTIISVLSRLSKTRLPADIARFIKVCTTNYGKVKLVLQHNRFFLESDEPRILRELLSDDVVRQARVMKQHDETTHMESGGFSVKRALEDNAASAVTLAVTEKQSASMLHGRIGTVEKALNREGIIQNAVMFEATQKPACESCRQTSSFEIMAERVEHVKQRCLPGNLVYPKLE
jgi:DNA excision repair protein ERCC-3